MNCEVEIINSIEETRVEKTIQVSDSHTKVQETDFKISDTKPFGDESVNKAFDILFEATLEEMRSNP